MCSIKWSDCVTMIANVSLKRKSASSFYSHKEGRCTCAGDCGSRRLFPESRGCSGRTLWEVHCGAWRRAWQLSRISSLVLWRSRRRPASPSRRHGRRYRVYRLPGVAWRRSVGPAGQGLAYICAPAVVGHVAVPDPPVRSASACTKGVRKSRGGPGPLEGGRSGPPAASAEHPSLGDTWRHRTPSRAGDGSGAIGVVRWSPDSKSW